MFNLVCSAPLFFFGGAASFLATGDFAFLILWGVADVPAAVFFGALAPCPSGMDLTSNLPGVGIADLDEVASFFLSAAAGRFGLPFSLAG